MRIAVVVGGLLVLAAMTTSAQTAAGIHVVRVCFDGDTQLKGVDLKKCAADLRSGNCEGPGWLQSVAMRAKECLEVQGYLNSSVFSSSVMKGSPAGRIDNAQISSVCRSTRDDLPL